MRCLKYFFDSALFEIFFLNSALFEIFFHQLSAPQCSSESFRAKEFIDFFHVEFAKVARESEKSMRFNCQ